MSEKNIWINEDNAHFYDCHPPEAMTVAGLERLVDTWCSPPESRVGGMLFCTNVQRALFDSRAWEPLYHDYHPDDPQVEQTEGFAGLPPESRKLTPDRRGRYWVHQLWLLKQRGIDHLQIWLDRCRHHGVSGWLTMRMNDCHHNDDERSFWHSTLWKSRPDLRRAVARDGDWFEGAMDYGQPEVVEHHLALVRELCTRYDFDGLELDWVRWVRHFKAGYEQIGAAVLNDVMRTARAEVLAAGRRQGRATSLGVRLPTDITACLQLGYDVLTWAREGLVDQITLAPFFQQAEYEWPIALWRELFGEKVKILCQPESIIRPYPEVGQSECFVDYSLLMGSAASAHQRGADGVYLFNECYRIAPGDRWVRRDPSLLGKLTHHVGDHALLRETPRRQVVSHNQIVGPGAAGGSVLPIALTKPPGYWSFGRHGRIISVRICLGGRPSGSALRIELGLDVAVDPQDLKVWLNGHQLSQATNPADVHRPTTVKQVLAWEVPPDQAMDDVNIVEILPSENLPGRLLWAEMIVIGLPSGLGQR